MSTQLTAAARLQLKCTVCTVQPLGPGDNEKENTNKKHDSYSRLVACLLANCCGLVGIAGIEAEAGLKTGSVRCLVSCAVSKFCLAIQKISMFQNRTLVTVS